VTGESQLTQLERQGSRGARVAAVARDPNRFLAAVTAGWSTILAGSYNWYTRTYVAYCDLLARWAVAASDTTGKTVAADEFERALFAGRPLDD
jgi:hypothetical protein